jgi:hypothetical protein
MNTPAEMACAHPEPKNLAAGAVSFLQKKRNSSNGGSSHKNEPSSPHFDIEKNHAVFL